MNGSVCFIIFVAQDQNSVLRILQIKRKSQRTQFQINLMTQLIQPFDTNTLANKKIATCNSHNLLNIIVHKAAICCLYRNIIETLFFILLIPSGYLIVDFHCMTNSNHF
ncbi:hypothetical protein ACKWTF_006565 [Chironomus riparius]